MEIIYTTKQNSKGGEGIEETYLKLNLVSALLFAFGGTKTTKKATHEGEGVSEEEDLDGGGGNGKQCQKKIHVWWWV